MVKRAAFTFIELIFAIVIISVVVMSLPVMSNLLTKSTESNVVQEAIFAAATELSELTTYHWDDNSIDENTSRAGIINVDSSCEDDDTNSRYRLRPGHILEAYHRKCIKDLTLSSADANVSDTLSVDDVALTLKNALENSDGTVVEANAEGYKDEYKTKVTIDHDVTSLSNITINNAAPRTSTTDLAKNIKKITVVIKDQNDKDLTALSSYIANIGEVDFYKRSY